MALPRFGAEDDPLTYSIIGCAIKVHKKIGPGLGESVYDECMVTELQSAGLSFKRHSPVRIPYEGKLLDKVFRPDFVIEGEVLLELKSINAFLPVHDAQILTYMRRKSPQRRGENTSLSFGQPSIHKELPAVPATLYDNLAVFTESFPVFRRDPLALRTGLATGVPFVRM